MRLQCTAGFRVVYLLILVGVKASQGGHGQDFSGFAVHYQAKGPVLNGVPVYGGLELFFKTGLHGGVQRQNDAASRWGVGVIFIGIGHIHFVVALCCNDLSGFAGKKPVIGRLDSLAALPGTVGKANDLAGKAPEGIGPQCRRFQVDAGNALLLHIGPDALGRLLRHSGTHLLIAAAGILPLLHDPPGIPVYQRC